MEQQRRRELHSLLSDIPGVESAWFQPPEDVLLVYPVIVYHQEDLETEFAGNRPYRRTKGYQVMVMDEDPESTIPDSVSALAMCTFVRHYAANGLNHWVFSIYF